MGFKKGWRAYKATKRKSSSKRKSSKKKGGNRMSKGRSMIPTFFKLIRLGSLVAPALSRALRTDASPKLRLTWALMDYTGFNMDDGSFKWNRLARGWMPYISTSIITHAVPKLNGMMKKLIRF